jgi:conjugal transfer pilus assembly protein TraF
MAVPAMETSWWTETPWDNPERGFNWYPDPMAEQKEPPKHEPPPPKKKTIYEMATAEETRPNRGFYTV